ncbi:hypothetical protein, no similarity [Maudiozyma barnettii]|uniref:DUF1746 domain-containing protein n=1 Tax=Maudiozyma barnettii TaxID=61262 RepID=A0A8H2VH21_9SACH|nr:hypothetical protein, no similarity [Kazachstania barnettii]CAB4255291.1 hypothetical protein, no similarity [Kazachstania barnettii]CAD1783698.1 hypothetical protein, no similarity [Kazachstania barnettii]
MVLFTKHEHQRDLTKQLLVASQLLIFIRFSRDRSFLLACINISILGVVMLISQIVDHQYELTSAVLSSSASSTHRLSSETDHSVVRNTVNKLMDNLQTAILFQTLYSMWYHWTVTHRHPDRIYDTIFLFLIEDSFPLNAWPTLFSVILDTILLIIQLIMINIQNSRMLITTTTATTTVQDPYNGSSHREDSHVDIDNQTVLGFLTNNYYYSYHHNQDTATQEPLLQEHTASPATDYGSTT